MKSSKKQAATRPNRSGITLNRSDAAFVVHSLRHDLDEALENDLAVARSRSPADSVRRWFKSSQAYYESLIARGFAEAEAAACRAESDKTAAILGRLLGMPASGGAIGGGK